MRLRSLKPTESDIQATIVAALRQCGYIVMETGKSRAQVPCKTCGSKNYATGWQGNTPGIADVIVSHVDWPKNVWHMLEIKKPGGKRRQEQIDLALYGASIFVESVYAALAEVCRFEHKTLKLTINQRLFDVSQQFWDKETESMIANARQGVSS